MVEMPLLPVSTRHLFFTGKGGAGKTSLACATGISLADAGRRVLLVSTDPASNLDEVLGVRLGSRPTPVPDVPNLFALNIDPQAAAREYRERVVGPYRSVLPDSAVSRIEEQFSGSCTLEIAAFDAFARLIGDPESTREFDHVLFDTAPTGHTLRLLSLPSAWAGFLSTNTTGMSCVGPLAGLPSHQTLYQECIRALGDEAQTMIVLVARPAWSSLSEAARASRELAEIGIRNQHLAINGVFQATDRNDEVAVAWERHSESALAAVPYPLSSLPSTHIPLSPHALIGTDALRGMGKRQQVPVPEPVREIAFGDERPQESLAALVDDLAKAGHGVILTMGKGGVGKTTIAAAVAIGLAERGHPVHLSTTDPAAHLEATVVSGLPTLRVSRIDPEVECAAYAADVMATAGAGLDEAGRSLLIEDLRSPCTVEIAVFQAFARTVAEGSEGFVVLDTAPTGHTLLLLDGALAHHREVLRQSSRVSDAVQYLMPRLREPASTRVLIVTLPEATPVHEAAELQRELRRAGIEPHAWIVNQSLTPCAVTDPVLSACRVREASLIREVRDHHASRSVLVPWQLIAPVGVDPLRQLSESSSLAPIR
jgi:arsenite-transporting ATPase